MGLFASDLQIIYHRPRAYDEASLFHYGFWNLYVETNFSSGFFLHQPHLEPNGNLHLYQGPRRFSSPNQLSSEIFHWDQQLFHSKNLEQLHPKKQPFQLQNYITLNFWSIWIVLPSQIVFFFLHFLAKTSKLFWQFSRKTTDHRDIT